MSQPPPKVDRGSATSAPAMAPTATTSGSTITIGRHELQLTPKRVADRQRAARVVQNSPTKKGRRYETPVGSVRPIGDTSMDDPFPVPPGRPVPGPRRLFISPVPVPPIPTLIRGTACLKPPGRKDIICTAQEEGETSNLERQVANLRSEAEELKGKNSALEAQVERLTTELEQLKDAQTAGSIHRDDSIHGNPVGREGFLRARENCRIALLEQRDRESDQMREVLSRKKCRPTRR
ncbi:hypothetical protein HD553DRAFT_344170 [Filobasidium floriforme]|uniref:uncharacterized protein n=1 Tax=Filobasidium floriforme TaxID=5210 RepID=UPI001E8D3100|nr:uncharacterized protein HD553DRAFT_344170 [Filobasidium floriforme]KAH8081466.1 hypothetical protein HD553DRAFT_344170 [Filobasidium floriforme]